MLASLPSGPRRTLACSFSRTLNMVAHVYGFAMPNISMPDRTYNTLWMRMMVDYMEHVARGVQGGRRNGAGLGLQDLEWLQPVRPGHTLTYTYEIIEKSDKVVRDQWGIIKSRNEAFNQYNEPVMSFTIDILAERNPELLAS